MGQALYRKYRSKKLSEIVGQEHITGALEQALKTNRISHAYLFTGPRGIGKTSIARILAHQVNQLPYEEDATHLDIIEIDAASNRRIDEIRDLRDKIHVAPTTAKYKVYIIDEVHMLTREAFNALLKTLEEPPAHVIFILATTEVHKLPETIISRTQHFTFRPIETSKAIEHLKSIAKKEKTTIDDEALKLIAEHGNGSFRDSISILDQVSSQSNTISAADIESLLGIAPEQAIVDLAKALESGNAPNLINTLQQLRQQGIAPVLLAKQLATQVRNSVISNQSSSPQRSLLLLQNLIGVSQSPDPYATLEVLLLEYVFSGAPVVTTTDAIPKQKPADNPPKKPTASKPAPPKAAEKANSDNTITPIQPEVPSEVAPEPIPKPEETQTTKEPQPETEEQSTSSGDAIALDAATWKQVLDVVKQKYNTLYGVLRMAEPDFSGNTITLTLSFAFHQKRLNEPKNKQIIADAIAHITHQNPEIICVVASKDSKKDSKNTEASNPVNPIGNISNIFGGAELLES